MDIYPDMKTGSVAFYSGIEETPQLLEARHWIDAVKNNTDPLVLPEQACVVSEILEAIYTSAANARPVFF